MMIEIRENLSALLLFICVLISSIGYTQDKDIRGLVLVDFRNEYPEGVVVINKRTNTYSITDMSGSFHVKAQKGDTLLFQGDYLMDRKLVIKASTFDLDPFIVHMNYEIITLADVIAKQPLTGDLEKDIKSVKIREDVEQIYANLGIDIRTLDMKPKERKADIIPNRIGAIPIPTSMNVEALYKSISGYYRRMENLNQFERLEKRLVDVKEYLGSKYFKDIIGISEEDTREFLLYVYDHSDNRYESYYLQSDYLSLDHLLQKHAGNFKARLKARDKANAQQEGD